MIELTGVGFTAGLLRLHDLNLYVDAGESVALMGRSGAGKTSLIEVICGLRPLDAGRVMLNGVDVTRWDPADRRIGYVPQDLALFPHLSVREQLEFAPRMAGTSAKVYRSRCEQWGELLGIRALWGRSVLGLSGGELQRVAIGRALSAEPQVLLLDEPFSSLDEATRLEMRALLNQVQTETRVAALYVTHNAQEARMMGQRILNLEGGFLRPVVVPVPRSEAKPSSEIPEVPQSESPSGP
ncbi:MAG: ATP-binding cassette domain-containing protein [Planctomycetota bacterium]|nr:MAG: ATP-binding cassette domain-containing protein [Planctomycetota bacterium]